MGEPLRSFSDRRGGKLLNIRTVGASIIRIGFGAHYIIGRIRNPQDISRGNYIMKAPILMIQDCEKLRVTTAQMQTKDEKKAHFITWPILPRCHGLIISARTQPRPAQ